MYETLQHFARHFARSAAMSKHDGASEHAAKASRPSSNSATFYEIDMTEVRSSHSLMEALLQKSFKDRAGDERRTAIAESLREAEKKIAILKRFLSDA